MAYGVLEDSFKEDMPIDACVGVATRAAKAALQRDAFSGDGIDVVKITEKGFERMPE